MESDKVELQGNDTAAAGTSRSHLSEAGDLSELALQRCGDRAGHHLGAGTWIERHHLDGGVVHFRQGGDWELLVRDETGKQNGHHQKRGGHRPEDKWP